jgi:hypothetical protein
MAIRRAGPFASITDSFRDEPATPSSGIPPVNCARDTTSVSWPWKHYKRISNSEDSGQDVLDYVSGFPSVSASYTSSSGDEGGGIVSEFSFACQCVDETVFTLSYNLSASQPFELAQVGVTVTIDNVTDFNDSDSGPTASVSGSTTITIQKSVVPTHIKVLLISQEVSTVNGGSASMSASIT